MERERCDTLLLELHRLCAQAKRDWDRNPAAKDSLRSLLRSETDVELLQEVVQDQQLERVLHRRYEIELEEPLQ